MTRVLVVDDEDLARFTLRDILESSGFEVVEATNGNEAIERQKNQPAALAVIDIIMPEKEGVETITELKRDHPALKIIAISGGGRTHNLDFLELAREIGADDILAKPFSEEDLMRRVKDCLAG